MTFYIEKINKLFFYWLLTSLFLIIFMVLVGGFTRLTNSGLSITEWELFKGIIPPINSNDWDRYFSLYKEIPQYKLVNYQMTLDEFKIIFYWEYFHRILGRIIGLFFFIPLVYFYFKKQINKKYLFNCCFILFLILLQGAIGWYMVSSGLTDNISVSHFRLSLHLILAFIIISLIFWNLLNIKNDTQKKFLSNNRNNYIFYFLILLIFLQIMFGAFVSGLDAGKIYQTWPLMNYNYFPNDVIINKIDDFLDFNNHSLIQFYHRNIAYFIFFYIFFIGFFIFKNNIKHLLKPFYLVVIFLILQIILGIFSLTTNLNIYIASGHQICSLLLTLSVINLYYHYIK